MRLDRRTVFIGALAVPAAGVAWSQPSAEAVYAEAERNFLNSQWALIAKERLANIYSDADNEPEDHARLLTKFGVAFDPAQTWKINGHQIVSEIGAIRLARLTVEFGLASESEARLAAAEPMRLWRTLSAHPRRPT